MDAEGMIRQIADAVEAPLDRIGEAIRRAAESAALWDGVVDHFVGAARAEGHSWADIGGALGVTKQAAQQRFREPEGLGMKRFTEETRAAVRRAQDVARERRHATVTAEHLLHGLLAVQGGAAASALADAGIDAALVAREVLEAIPATVGDEVEALTFSPDAKSALAQSLSEALRSRENRVEPEHLLLAIARVAEGPAKEVLSRAGATVENLRRAALTARVRRAGAISVRHLL